MNKPETRSTRAPTGTWMLSTQTFDMAMTVESWILTDHRQALTWRKQRNDGLHGAEDTNTSFHTSRTTHTTKSNRQSICRMRLSTSASEKKTATSRSIDPCTIAQNWYVEFARTSATRVTMFCHHGWTKRCSPGDLVRRGGTARSPERLKFQAAVSDTVAPV